ncbi:MAG: hypothetical protein AABY16_00690 [Nanoarchaeota archaeon]
MMRQRGKILFFLFIILIFITIVILFVRIKLSGLTISSPVGTTTTSWVQTYIINSIATFTTNTPSLQLPPGATLPVYAMDGANVMCFDVTGDGVEELLYGNGDRFGLISGSTGSEFLYVDGYGGINNRKPQFLVIRINDDPSNPNKYVVVKPGANCAITTCPSGCQTTCPFWEAHQNIDVVALTNFNEYAAGQKISSIDWFSGAIPSLLSLTTNGDIILEPGTSIRIVGTTRVYEYMAMFDLSLSASGVISLTPVAQIGLQSSNPSNGAPTCTTAFFGNGGYHTRVCRQDASGVCTGVYDDIYINNDVWRVSGSSFVRLGGIVDHYGAQVPVAQGGLITLDAHNCDQSSNHMDANIIWNAGTEQNPNYYVASMLETADRTLISSFRINQAGTLTYTPLVATIGSGAQQISLGYIEGYSGPAIINGRYVFNAINGQIVADATFGIGTESSIWHTNPLNAGGYAIGGQYGFQIQSGIPTLRHVMPTVVSTNSPNSGTDFWSFASANVPPGNENLKAMTTLTNSEQGGTREHFGLCYDYDISANTISFKAIKAVSQKAAVAFKSIDEATFVIGVTQAHKDAALKYVLQPQVSGKDSVDGLTIIRDLANLGLPAVCGNGNAEPGEQCGEPSLPLCASGFTCSNCQCVSASNVPNTPLNLQAVIN